MGALQNVMPGRWKQAIANLATHRWIGEAVSQIYADLIPCAGFRIDVSLAAIQPSTKAGLLLGLYERAELRCLARHLRTDLDVVELGSSLGVISCHLHRKIGPGRRLVCVEADPFLADLTASNLRRNAAGRDVLVLNRAVHHGQGAGTIRFASTGQTTTGHVDVDAADGVDVPVATLSQVLAEARIVGPYALFADIEGSEAGLALEDAAALADCQQIIAELHDTTHRGSRFSPEDIAREFETRHRFRTIARDGNVWVFGR